MPPPAQPAPAAAPPDRDGETLRPQDVKTSRRPDVKTAPDRISYTWRITPDQADQVDDLVRRMRRQLGVRRLDRGTVLLALVDLATDRDDVRAALLKRLESN